MPKTLDNEDRLYLVRSYRDKALESLEDAKDFLERRFGLSVRMSYEATYLGQLEKDRNIAQYNPIAKIQIEDAQNALQKAELFYEVMQKLIEKNITKLEDTNGFLKP